MTTEELKTEKKRLELKIQGIIQAFKDETGFSVKIIEVNTVDTSSKCGPDSFPSTVEIYLS